MDLNLSPDQETPDINYSEDLMETETPIIDSAENEKSEYNLARDEAVQIDKKGVETEESDIGDLDEGEDKNDITSMFEQV